MKILSNLKNYFDFDKLPLYILIIEEIALIIGMVIGFKHVHDRKIKEIGSAYTFSQCNSELFDYVIQVGYSDHQQIYHGKILDLYSTKADSGKWWVRFIDDKTKKTRTLNSTVPP